MISTDYKEIANGIFRHIKSKVPSADTVYTVAVDGRCGSGKTTVAKELARISGDAFVIHTDDFFLPSELRTAERKNIPGGNIHKERFIKEVLPFINKKPPFSYRRFDCGIRDYGDTVYVPASHIRIVEGSYSHHPDFGAYADLKVFISVDCETQMQRIIARNGAEKAEVFKSVWIPLEERYFECFGIPEKSDLIFVSE